MLWVLYSTHHARVANYYNIWFSQAGACLLALQDLVKARPRNGNVTWLFLTRAFFYMSILVMPLAAWLSKFLKSYFLCVFVLSLLLTLLLWPATTLNTGNFGLVRLAKRDLRISYNRGYGPGEVPPTQPPASVATLVAASSLHRNTY
jgi:hypothetical protein